MNVLWEIAANDKGKANNDRYDCNGCFQYTHDVFKNDTSDLGKWKLAHQDPYPLMVAFGIILCVFWLVVAVLGLLNQKPLLSKIVNISSYKK